MFRWSSPAGDLVKTLGRQILKSNGRASPYSQPKWKFSIKTIQLKILKVFEPNSKAKTVPDNGIAKMIATGIEEGVPTRRAGQGPASWQELHAVFRGLVEGVSRTASREELEVAADALSVVRRRRPQLVGKSV